jgi:hypothetical protein
MSVRLRVRFVGVAVVAAAFVSVAGAYIHFPPMTLQKMCKQSHSVRLLKVTKIDKEKGVVAFEVAENLKPAKSAITSFKTVLRAETEGTKAVLEWAKEDKTAVMFAIEGNNGTTELGIAYVFIDDYCYTADYNRHGKYWLMIRGEPGMSACYHGSVDDLRKLIKDVLDGKEVKVPVKEPAKKEDREKRNAEINDVLKKNRSGKD